MDENGTGACFIHAVPKLSVQHGPNDFKFRCMTPNAEEREKRGNKLCHRQAFVLELATIKSAD